MLEMACSGPLDRCRAWLGGEAPGGRARREKRVCGLELVDFCGYGRIRRGEAGGIQRGYLEGLMGRCVVVDDGFVSCDVGPGVRLWLEVV